MRIADLVAVKPLRRPPSWLVMGLGVGVMYSVLLSLLWRTNVITPDFFPLYLGAELVFQGQSPYGPAATAVLSEQWNAPDPFPAAGIAYPLPVLLLIMPISWLPYPVAALVWIMLSAGLALLATRLTDAHPLTLLCYWPFFWAIVLGQASLTWFGLCVLLVFAIQRQRTWLIGLCIALLPLKPQSGIIFALYGLWWAWQYDRRALGWAIGIGAGLGISSLLVQPGWIMAWLEQVAVYRTYVRPVGHYLWLPILLAATWNLPWWAKLSIVQIFAFPLVPQEYGLNPYTIVALGLVWVAIGGRIGLVGALLTWLWPLLFFGGYATWASTLVLLTPLTLAAAYRSWGER
jgi:hypothetical protein